MDHHITDHRQISRHLTGSLPRRGFLKTLGATLAGLGLTSALQIPGAQAAETGHAGTQPGHAGGGSALATPAGGKRAVRTGQFVFPRLQFSVYDESVDIWNVGPIGDVNLRRKLAELTNINVSQEPRVVRLGDLDDMCRNPFVFMTSEGYFKLQKDEEDHLHEFLERGGFIHADDCVFRGQDRFFQTYRTLINKLYPDNPMRKIPYDHEIFHCYFDFPNGAPHCQGVPNGAWGLFEPGTGRIMTLVTPGDLHCGWMCRFFTPEMNESALKMGINIIIYFLTH
jgi:hypothetical protein